MPARIASKVARIVERAQVRRIDDLGDEAGPEGSESKFHALTPPSLWRHSKHTPSTARGTPSRRRTTA